MTLLLSFGTHSSFGQGPILFPPSIAILDLEHSALFRSLEPIALRARTFASGHVLTEVRFLDGTNLLGTAQQVSSNEYVLNWRPSRQGNYAVQAEASYIKPLGQGRGVASSGVIRISVHRNAPSYSLVELTGASTNDFFAPRQVTDHGSIVGAVTNTAARWQRWSVQTWDVFGQPSVAVGESTDGVIAGNFQNQPFVIYPGAAPEHLSGFSFVGGANAVSRAGIVGTGSQYFGDCCRQGFLIEAGVMTLIGQGARCEIKDINDDGLAVGSHTTHPQNAVPIMYKAGEMTVLPGGEGAANSVNNRGQVVGTVAGEAFAYEDGQMSLLGRLGRRPTPVDNNESGQAVGHYNADADGRVSFEPFRACLFLDGAAIDLNHLIPTNPRVSLHYAISINRQGWIVGWGRRPGDFFGIGENYRGFLLVPGPMLRLDRVTGFTLEGRIYSGFGRAVLECSSNGSPWMPVVTNQPGMEVFQFSIPRQPGDGSVLYRAVQR
ncbi:MAG: hypothetical protein ACKVYV_17555 [Limisphaerales bacterium]